MATDRFLAKSAKKGNIKQKDRLYEVKKMKMKNFLKLFARARKIIDTFGDFFRTCREILCTPNASMNDEELGIFATVTFYLFTILLGVSILVFPVMILFGYPAFMAMATLMSIGLAFPAALVKVGVKYSNVLVSKMLALFEKYSLPLIGLKKSGKKIYKVQMKIQFVNTFSISVLCYILAKIMLIGKWNSLSTEFAVILLCFSWATAMPMALNGIFIYSICFKEFIGDEKVQEIFSEYLCKAKNFYEIGREKAKTFLSAMVSFLKKYALPLIGLKEKLMSVSCAVVSHMQEMFRKSFPKAKNFYEIGREKAKTFLSAMVSFLNKHEMPLIGLKRKMEGLAHLKVSQIKANFENQPHRAKNFYVISVGNAKRLKKMDIETIMMLFRNIFRVKQVHKPKRLAVQTIPKSEKNFSLRMLAIDWQARGLNARRTAFYINGGGNS